MTTSERAPLSDAPAALDGPIATTAPTEPDQLPTVEQHAEANGTPAWLLGAIRQHFGWGAGRRVGVTEFADASKQVLSIPIGAPSRGADTQVE